MVKNFEKNLYFINSMGNWRMIARNVNREKAVKVMHKFCEERGFQIHYTRIWEENSDVWFDVGSHTEFFVASDHTEMERLKGRDF